MTVTPAAAARRHYDAIVVGAGWAGSLIAERLGAKGWQVLVLEAGNGGTETWPGYLDSLDTFYSAVAKVPNSAYRPNRAVPSPDVLDMAPIRPTEPGGKEFTSDGYFVQEGPLPYGTDYLRALGGAGMHWLGAVPRMHPDDFAVRRDYEYGRDWPLTAADLQPFYARAEREMGVAGDAAEQRELGVVHDPAYVYPMHGIPRSYLDAYCAERLDGHEIVEPVGGQAGRLKVTALPQARNSTPDPRYDGGRGFRPSGASGLPNYGERCVGNASCVPICPVQAKSSPLRVQARFDGGVTLATRSVVTRVLHGRGGTVRGVEYRTYGDPATPVSEPYTAEADIVVLAAHAIENARLMLFSEAATTSGEVGKNLMDHPTMLAWGLSAEADGLVGPYRGPGHTSGVEVFRFGAARRARAPFRIELGNWGWGWATGAPMSNVAAALGVGGTPDGEVRSDHAFGPGLRRLLGSAIGRQLQLQIAIEQSADPANRVTIDPRRYRDPMGNPRPIITYDLDDHVRDGMVAAHHVAGRIFRRLGATDHTSYAPQNGVPPIGHLTHTFGGAEVHLAFRGAGHGAGTHIMGTSARNSVVDSFQRTHDHPNLYAVGCGSMPSIGTSNPTVTMAALALRSADHIDRQLAGLHRPAALRPPAQRTAARQETTS
ncbi:GMC family oxidoreductase [Actinomadura algeriensis]|uniref:Choline dehydrogenase-like flavoprotein n=1 Tax=Actinomadura algeriensis TaxID=1679523 RepID=A0ABR9K1I5_9ACTN|nr:GMC family oxidoreductase [Actinomadura algeriensis]MBE1536696.1 choline dehydrogenase-like flavoprotein [Actinomadura algeriensis]